MQIKNAIVTGATSAIGIALINELLDSGANVTAIHRKGSARKKNIPAHERVRVIEADLHNLESDIEASNPCDIFFHLAWEGIRDDFADQYKNIKMTLDCLKLAEKLGCKRFICTGTQAEYGETTELITEKTPLKPTNAYGACKVAAYYLTVDLARKMNIEHTWARVFSVYGPNDNSHTLFSSLICDLNCKGKSQLKTNGEHIWNYLHENDAAKALMLLGVCESTNTAFNVASKVNKPLKDYFEGFPVDVGKEISAVNLNVNVDKLISAIGEYERHDFKNVISTLLAT